MRVMPTAGEAGPSTTRETRSLPAHAPGAVDTPFVIQPYDEVVSHDTLWDAHSHPFHELLWNERGASSAVVGERIWTITPALGLWMPAGTLHSGSATAGTWFRASFFGFRTTSSISDTPVAVEITPLLRLLLERLGEPGLAPSSRAATEALVLDVLAPSPRELLVQVPTSALLRPIADAVREDPGDQRTLADWASELGVSTRTVTRAFSAETGTSFVRWVATVRAQHAIGLLTRGWDVESVAEQVGYRSASAFGVAFRRTTGLTPGTFRPELTP
ncbi:AraC family transcriptional regulator [Streptomyces sp. ME02-6991-2A]|uniref:helix-turn-helix domain-containing protein n=1 Tax=Streptomyces sp. ME02-6991-2A TaxID=3028677 RepID=UPI00100808C0|nr:AraC family transcriptional regulator [Streptomyces sp. ME02-6991-2A]MDX3374427.1 AraC family transcriptional regulator [Streptomyces sp. ME02-6991-2A]